MAPRHCSLPAEPLRVRRNRTLAGNERTHEAAWTISLIWSKARWCADRVPLPMRAAAMILIFSAKSLRTRTDRPAQTDGSARGTSVPSSTSVHSRRLLYCSRPIDIRAEISRLRNLTQPRTVHLPRRQPRAILVAGADQHHWRAEIQDRGFDADSRRMLMNHGALRFVVKCIQLASHAASEHSESCCRTEPIDR